MNNFGCGHWNTCKNAKSSTRLQCTRLLEMVEVMWVNLQGHLVLKLGGILVCMGCDVGCGMEGSPSIYWYGDAYWVMEMQTGLWRCILGYGERFSKLWEVRRCMELVWRSNLPAASWTSRAWRLHGDPPYSSMQMEPTGIGYGGRAVLIVAAVGAVSATVSAAV